jgi:uncharacterized protein YndB with AHSA1/START domain
MEAMETTDLTVSRTINGTPEAVYDAWLDRDGPGSMFFGSKRVILNLEVGGLFYILVDREGREWAHYGRFDRLERGKTLEHTWMSEPTQGLESVVTVTFAPVDGGTKVTLRHANVPDTGEGRSHKEGWAGCLDALAKRVED